MASIFQNIAAIRQAVYGRETRIPIVEILKFYNDPNLKYFSDIYEYRTQQIRRAIDSEPQLDRVEVRHKERVQSIVSVELKREIDWIEVIEHIIQDPPTMYELIGNNNISVSQISDDEFRALDSGSSVSKLSGDDYKMNAGDNWSITAFDHPTHTEYEYITHWVPDYRLKFKRVSET